MKIYVENLHSSINDKKLGELFSSYGEIKSAHVVMDVFTDVSRGFGYVEMEDEPAQKAISELNGTSLNDLRLTLKEALYEPERKGSYKVGNGSPNVYRFRKN